jgi:hypothetical protein
LNLDEQVLWTAKPEKKSFRLSNIERTFFDFIKQVLFIFFFLEIYDFIFHKELLMQTDFPIFKLSVPLILLINTIVVVTKIVRVDKVMYCVTERRILAFSDIERQKIKTVDKLKIKKKKITATSIEKKNNVHTIKLVTDDEDVMLESIDNRFEI